MDNFQSLIDNLKENTRPHSTKPVTLPLNLSDFS